MSRFMLFIHDLQPVHGVLLTHFIATCVLAWHSVRSSKSADRWQGVAQGLLRQKNADTAKTRVWQAPAALKQRAR
jgi:hypothetical protein